MTDLKDDVKDAEHTPGVWPGVGQKKPKGALWAKYQDRVLTVPVLATVAGISVAGIIGTVVFASVASHNFADFEVEFAEVQRLTTVVEDTEAELKSTAGELTDAKVEVARIDRREDAVVQLETDLATRESEVAAREAAVKKTEEHIAANSVADGTYTVGVSLVAGTYSTTNSNSSCYWAIYTSGTNYDDIIENDLGATGTLFVTLSGGQDFESKRCGTWTRVG